MNNMRIAVCDDEKQIVEHIEKLIVRYANSFNMVINTDTFSDGPMLISVAFIMILLFLIYVCLKKAGLT